MTIILVWKVGGAEAEEEKELDGKMEGREGQYKRWREEMVVQEKEWQENNNQERREGRKDVKKEGKYQK